MVCILVANVTIQLYSLLRQQPRLSLHSLPRAWAGLCGIWTACGLNPALFQPPGRAAGSHVDRWEIRNDCEPSAGDVSSAWGEAQAVARQWMGNPQ